MSKSRVFEDYTITTQLMEESGAFYLQFYNTLLHKKYEANVAYDTLGLPGKPAEVFTVLNYCLDKKEGYNFGFALNGSIMGVMFDAKIGGVLSVSFAITLNEISVSGDTVVSYKLNELESELAYTREILAKTNDELDSVKEELAETKEELATVKRSIGATDKYVYELSNTVVTLQGNLNKVREDHTQKLLSITQSMKQMETTIGRLVKGCSICIATTHPSHVPYLGHTSYPDTLSIKKCYNVFTNELELSNVSYGGPLVDWTILYNFPVLTKLTVKSYAIMEFAQNARSDSLLDLVLTNDQSQITSFSWLPRFPNLVSIDTKDMSNLKDILDFLPKCPKIKHIRIHTASPALVQYCVVNGIELE